jgi:hypothetical protein
MFLNNHSHENSIKGWGVRMQNPPDDLTGNRKRTRINTKNPAEHHKGGFNKEKRPAGTRQAKNAPKYKPKHDRDKTTRTKNVDGTGRGRVVSHTL